MRGFDPKFKDLPGYIIGITAEIWEGRGIDSLNHYYAPDIPVRSPDGVVIGNQKVIAATKATLDEFPDRQLLAEDVIWSGNEDDGFLSSHRIISTATHTNDGIYGKARGHKLQYRIIADCAVKNNQIYDEWLIRDQGAIIAQLGVDPKAYAADQIASQGGPSAATTPFHPENDVPGDYKATGNDNEWGERHAALLNDLMGGNISQIQAVYDRAVQQDLPGGIVAYGWHAAETFWADIRSAFPSAKFEIHHQIGNDSDLCPGRSALRWSLTGSHDGQGRFGHPTGAPVHVMGISHGEFGPRRLKREFVLFDDTQIWKQILLHTG